jgi:hypothetical protein
MHIIPESKIGFIKIDHEEEEFFSTQRNLDLWEATTDQQGLTQSLTETPGS